VSDTFEVSISCPNSQLTTLIARPKLAFVANTTWFISNFKVSLLNYLADAGFEIYVIAPPDDYLHYLHQVRHTHHIPLPHLNRKGMNPLQELRLFSAFRRIYRDLQPDVVVHNTIKPNIYGSIAARLSGIPSVMVIPGLGHVFIEGGIRQWIIEQLYKWVARFNAKVVFENTDDLKEFIRRRLIPAEKGHAFQGIGVDTTVFLPQTKTRSDGKTVFAFLGRLIYEKGVGEFVEAARLLHSKYGDAIACWLVGGIDNDNPSGVQTMDLLRWIEEKNITYFGHIGDVREVIKETDCVVLPSYYREGGPKVLQEAMSMTKPIITTDMPGCREAVENGVNGFLVAPRDAVDLAAAMEKIHLLSAAERQKMGEKGRAKAVAELDYSISNPVYLDIIRSALKKENAASSGL
jgi:glycosyltransferase involved in cell wall biosynthesis